jgi:hypothetical protein
MSGDQHPDLQRFYAQILSGDDNDEGWMDEDDDDGDQEYEVYFDPDDMDDDDEDYANEDDDEYEEGEGDEDMGNAQLRGAETIRIGVDPDDDSSGSTFLELAALLNSAGASTDARSSLLARLLAGPVPAGPTTRSGGQGLLSRLGLAGAMTPEERERAARAEGERRKESWWTPQTTPHPRGVELLKSGEFGMVGGWRASGRHCVRPRVIETGRRSRGYIPPMSAVRFTLLSVISAQD